MGPDGCGRRAGPYSPAGGMAGSTAISATDPSIVEWATGATIDRGLVEIDNPSLGYATYGGTNGSGSSQNNAPIGQPPQPQSTLLCRGPGPGRNRHAHLRPADYQRSGLRLRRLRQRLFRRAPWNGCKPAFVEVSSDGVNFFRFPSVSLTPTTTQVGSGGELDPTNLYDLAGKDPAATARRSTSASWPAFRRS